MIDAPLALAFTAGLVATVNPCGFAMLPAYVSWYLGGEEAGSAPLAERVGRALLVGGTVSVGFLVVFGIAGTLVTIGVRSFVDYVPWVALVIGAALGGLGVAMLAGRKVTLALPQPTAAAGPRSRRLRSMLVFGTSYAIASLSCTIGPFLAVTSATFRSGSILDGVLAYLAYGAGMTLVVGVLATAVALASSAVTTGFRRLLPHINRIGGGLLVLVGAYVGYYGIYELRLYFGGGDASDPVIEAAGVIQETVAGWVDSIGVLPMLAALAGLSLGAVLLKRRKADEQPQE
jgi:cytochrome c biogenesis protein CcdA